MVRQRRYSIRVAALIVAWIWVVISCSLHGSSGTWSYESDVNMNHQSNLSLTFRFGGGLTKPDEEFIATLQHHHDQLFFSAHHSHSHEYHHHHHQEYLPQRAMVMNNINQGRQVLDTTKTKAHTKTKPKPKPKTQNANVTSNQRLKNAYVALQAWKKSIFSDPSGILSTWIGADVCSYKGVYCQPDPIRGETTVAGIDLNRANLGGFLPAELALLSDLALIHLNSNRFSGQVTTALAQLPLLFELDLSNNRFSGAFPSFLLVLPNLKFLDLRFNNFQGSLPDQLFSAQLDAIFVNNNRFNGEIPNNIGSSPASVIVLANNILLGCVPKSLGDMGATLNEIILLNNDLTGCLDPSIGNLVNLIVFDASSNRLTGNLPDTISQMVSIEEFNIAHNLFYGSISAQICSLPNLKNLTISDNYFTSESPICLILPVVNNLLNCILGIVTGGRSLLDCALFLLNPPQCSDFSCSNGESKIVSSSTSQISQRFPSTTHVP